MLSVNVTKVLNKVAIRIFVLVCVHFISYVIFICFYFSPVFREDIDECKELGIDACANGHCVNIVGSYKCECADGAVLDNTGRVCIGMAKTRPINYYILNPYACHR